LDKKIDAETTKEHDATAKGQAAQDAIPGLNEAIVECAAQKEIEDAALENMEEETKGKTHTFRSELESKMQQLAPMQQEKAEFQNHLDTAQTRVQLLQEATASAKTKLANATKELASLDQTQQNKRDELASSEDELEQCKNRISEIEKEDAQYAQGEIKLAAKTKDLRVSDLCGRVNFFYGL
jgi:chromosome segregation ATPase